MYVCVRVSLCVCVHVLRRGGVDGSAAMVRGYGGGAESRQRRKPQAVQAVQAVVGK